MISGSTMMLNMDPAIINALRAAVTSEAVSTNAIMRQPQLGQAELAHVAPHHPKIQFMVHSGPPIFVLPQIMRGGGEG